MYISMCSRNDDGITPMHQAASEGHVQCLKALVSAGGQVAEKDDRQHTPFDLAKLWGHRRCARCVKILHELVRMPSVDFHSSTLAGFLLAKRGTKIRSSWPKISIS